ncbi:ATP12 family chaperone protein [Fuscibacter oryzae]|uniref:ATPase n=1 Tax=Fuscibacter oryzae TaxID=2803939 RepID=A0A8J7MQS6_9RHOB|nr:ATP12 family protein [Fuscibacter oryzae]MBL4928443.1 ATPase [Fuscibacter oryzae]
MSAWKPKRFWKDAVAEACDGGFTVRLDGKPVKTPAKAAFVLPSMAMARAAAAEWAAQDDVVRPETMPVTRAANSAIDKLGHQFAEVVDLLAEYGGSDLLCYRATGPQALIDRQAAAWDPLLAWARSDLGVELRVTSGVMHVAQPPEALARLRAELAAATPFELAALHDMIAITGSLILGLAVARGHLSAAEAFSKSRIDEHWQIELWGEDEDAAKIEAAKAAALEEAARFHALCC